MKRLVYTLALVLLVSLTTFAQTGTAEQRAKNLSDKMIRELQLNNFQSRKLREINLKNAQKMVDFENKFANNPAELEKCINGVCKERDVELERLLSTAQYSQYYGARKSFNSFDRQYAQLLQKENGRVAKTLVAQDKTDAKRSFPEPQAAIIKESSPKN
ncbi:hypothetical protein ACD591_04605 [Rufibacter glacialis]|uniref:DUF4168 domain-containing protein n=1 Tax=Rufibacter glacialis TaxID=1259555 RepID=A0A5M8QI38_9BACT|nr:hypothetical protein [Rufibacter glacialis]KAA6434634.1 hypothetical protein FOE74_10665 [Rufibacter glacialis]GGK71225.1 hypothetical protein GCM10011405_19220 [Rufibacter glacialis]